MIFLSETALALTLSGGYREAVNEAAGPFPLWAEQPTQEERSVTALNALGEAVRVELPGTTSPPIPVATGARAERRASRGAGGEQDGSDDDSSRRAEDVRAIWEQHKTRGRG
jgi:hypothetical protein